MKRHTSGNNHQDIPQGHRCRGRVWFEKDGETYLGFGRIVLLERIREFGSISAAAKSMQMSYKHAWDLVDSMNRHGREPLVSTSKGGKGGGGAALTEAGELAVREYAALLDRLDTFLAKETSRLQALG
jgi:molybdate transport system regulatory protein